MNSIKIHKHLFSILIGILAILSSCEKTLEQNITTGEALLSVNLEGLDFEADGNILASNTASNKQTDSDTHIQHVNEDFRVESQLIPVANNRTENLKKDIKQNTSAVLKELGNNIKYKLLVYNANGTFVTERDYVYKQETLETAIPLNTYTEYIFVVVSSRSTTNIPQVEDKNDLSLATIKNANADLLHWKSSKMKLNKGQNFLAAKLKPKFSEVTTTLQMHNTMTGLITSISNPKFHPIANNISLKLLDGTATYGTVNTNGKAITFPSLGSGVRTITSLPTTLIHANTSAGELKFESLQVDDTIKNDITIAGLTFKPGHRYNLILTLKTCTEAVSGNGFDWEFAQTTSTCKEKYTERVWQDGYWSKGRWIEGKWIYVEKERNVTCTGIDFKPQGSSTTTFVKNGEIISFDFTEKGADYGFVYDITELDNAFNLSVNGTPIVGSSVSTGEVQFQNNATNTTQNIEFEDGSQYQSNQVPAIWTLIGTKAKPIVRVVIGRNGDVRLYGSKTSGGELLPLRLKNGLQFNKITWNGGDKTNIIKATSRVEGKTVMNAFGSGVKKTECK